MMKIVKNEKAKTRVKVNSIQQHKESESETDKSKLGLNKLFELII